MSHQSLRAVMMSYTPFSDMPLRSVWGQPTTNLKPPKDGTPKSRRDSAFKSWKKKASATR